MNSQSVFRIHSHPAAKGCIQVTPTKKARRLTVKKNLRKSVTCSFLEMALKK